MQLYVYKECTETMLPEPSWLVVYLGSRIGHLESENIENLLVSSNMVCFEFHEYIVITD